MLSRFGFLIVCVVLAVGSGAAQGVELFYQGHQGAAVGDVYDTVSNPGVFSLQAGLSYPGVATSGQALFYSTGDAGASVSVAMSAAASAAMGPSGAGKTYYIAFLQQGRSGPRLFDTGAGGSGKKFTLNFDPGDSAARAFIEETSNAGEGSHEVCGACATPNAPNLWLMRVQNQGFGNDDIIDIVVNPDLSGGEPNWVSDGGGDGIQVTNRDITSPSDTGYANLEWSPQGGFFGAENVRFDEFRLASSYDAAVPEPASMVLLGLGGLSLLARRRRS